jgi:hypothetical protein
LPQYRNAMNELQAGNARESFSLPRRYAGYTTHIFS